MLLAVNALNVSVAFEISFVRVKSIVLFWPNSCFLFSYSSKNDCFSVSAQKKRQYCKHRRRMRKVSEKHVRTAHDFPLGIQPKVLNN